MPHYRLNILACVLLAATPAAHAESLQPRNAAAAVRGLAPAQISAIRAIGRSVLAAKQSAAEDPADAAQLARLRGAVDTLISADFDPGNTPPVTLQSEESASQRKARADSAQRRAAARTDALAVAGQMRQHGALLSASRAQAGNAAEVRSAGLPIGGQRAQLFARLAQKLDAALADGNPERAVQLRALHEQLQAGKGRLVDAPLTHGTPTLQALPATGATPIRSVGTSAVSPQATPAIPHQPGIPKKSKSAAQPK